MRRINKTTAIEVLKQVANGNKQRAVFNNIDVPLIKAIVSKAKADLTITYGQSGIQVQLVKHDTHPSGCGVGENNG